MLSLGNKLTLPTQPIYHFVNKYSIDFDGVDDVIVTDGADTVAQPTTYAFWSKSSTTSANYGVFGHGASPRCSFSFNYLSSKPLLELGNSYYIIWSDNPAQDDGKWHQWVVYSDTNDITNSKLYCDGVLQTVDPLSTYTGSANAYTESLTIGGDKASGGNYFEGQIDEFAVYDRELTQAEITRMYNTYYTPNRVANGNFATIGNEEVSNGDFSEIGSELVTNGDFATDTGWTKGTGWTISGGSASNSGSANFSDLTQNNTDITIGKNYKITYTVSDYVSGSFKFIMNNNTASGLERNADGTYTDYISALSQGYSFRTQGSGFVGSIDNISVKEVGQDWTFGASWSMGDGKAIFTTGSSSLLQQDIGVVAGKSYAVSLELTGSGGNLYLGTNTAAVSMPVGTYTLYLTAASGANSSIGFLNNPGSASGTIDNISVKEVGQNWTFGTGWSTDGTKAVSDGSQTGNSWLVQGGALVVGRTYKVGFDLVVNSGQVVIDSYASPAALTSTNFYEFSFVAATTSFQIMANSTFTGSVDNIVVQELKSDATNLMLNAGAYQSANPLITSTKSMEFDGTDDYLQLGNLDYSSFSSFSISIWVNSSDTDGCIIQKESVFRLIQTAANSILFTIATSNNSWYNKTVTNTSMISGWNHIVGLYDGSNLKLYVNGSNLATTTGISGTILNNSNDVYFGRTTTAYYDGLSTEAGIYNRALTSLEVASLYNQGMPTNLLVNRNDYQSGNPTVFNTKQVDFDGTDDYMVAGLGSPVVTGSGAITLSAWVKTDQATSGYEGAFSVGVASTGQSHYLGRHNSNNWGAGIYDIDMSSGFAPVLNEWTHLVYTYAGGSGGSIKLYVNGVQKVTNTGTANVPTSSLSGTYIGSIANSTIYNFNGDISQAGVWNEELTADEVSSLYNHGLPIDLSTDQAAYESSSNLVGYWRMGSGTLDTYPLIADQTDATLGVEEVTNGNFTTADLSSFSVTYATQEIVSEELKVTLNTAYGYGFSFVTFPASVGKSYKISFSAKQGTSTGTRVITLSGLTLTASSTTTGDWSYEGIGVATATTCQFRLQLYGGSGDYAFFDNVSVKQVNGNPAIMTNQTSSDIENGSPYANLILDVSKNSTFEDATTNWASQGNHTATVESNQLKVVASAGGGTSSDATTLLADTYVGTLTNGKTYKYTFSCRALSGTPTLKIRPPFEMSPTTEDIVLTTVMTEYTIIGERLAMDNAFFSLAVAGTFYIDNITIEEVNTGLQGYWKMGDGTNDEYPVIYDQVDPTLGAELITNGDFSNGTTDWSVSSGTISVDNGRLKIDSVSGATAEQTVTAIIGKTYKVTYDLTLGTATSGATIITGGNYPTLDAPQGTNIFYSVATSTTFRVRPRLGSAGTMFVDNVSVKEVQGNPATMTNMVEGNITNQYPLTKIRNYWRMGDGILDGYPIIQDQTSPNLAHIPTTNLVTYSEDFSDSSWIKEDLTVSPNEIISPDGLLTADLLIPNTNNIDHTTYKVLNSNDKTFSVFAKAGGYNYLFLGSNNNVAADGVFFNLSNGTISQNTSGKSAEIIFYGNGWYRVSVTSVQTYSIICPSENGTSFVFAGDGVKGVYAWGGQSEEQTQATAYIKSDGIAAVRKATTTNLITYSEDFSQIYWTKTGASVTGDFISPDGTATAYKLIEDTSTGNHNIYTPNITVNIGSSYTFSLYVKKGELSNIRLDGGYRLSLDATFNLNTLVVTGNGKIQSLSNDWYRLSATGVGEISTGATNIFIYLLNNSGQQNYTGDGTSGMYIYGAQLEEQTQAETYAKTTGLPVTIDLFTENNYGTMTNMVAGDIVLDTPNNPA